VTVTNRDNKATNYTYHGNTTRLHQVINARSYAAATLGYNAGGQVADHWDAGNNNTHFDYSSGSGATVTLPSAGFQSGSAPSVTDTYQGSPWLSSRTAKPYGSSPSTEWASVSYQYDTALGTRTQETDASGNITTYCYDTGYNGQPTGSRGNLTRRILPVVTVSEPTGPRSTRPTYLYEYDANNNIVKEFPPKGVTTSSLTTCASNLAGSLAGAYATTRQYDLAMNQLLAVTRQDTDLELGLRTATTTYDYDPALPGQIVKEVPPRGNAPGANPDAYATRHTYYPRQSAQGGLRQDTTDSLNNRTSFTYDAAGRRVTQVEPRGYAAGHNPALYTTRFQYDNEDRPTITDAPEPNGGSGSLRTRYDYDSVGNRIKVTDARNHPTAYVYDARDLPIEVQETPLVSPPDPTNPTSDPNHVRTLYTYDALGNLYEVVRRLASDAAPKRTFSYRYDGLRQLRQEVEYPTAGTSSTRTYTYDGNGNQQQISKPNGTINYQYNGINQRITTIYSNQSVTFNYDANGNRYSMTDATGTTAWSYDERDQLTGAAFPVIGSATRNEVRYRYDEDGHRRKLIYPRNSQPLTYDWDVAGRMVRLTDWAQRQTTYQYWENGQLRSVSNPAP
jgi:YD repeat-containing protein